ELKENFYSFSFTAKIKRGRESEWEMKEALAPSGSPERGRVLFAEGSLLFLYSFSLLYGVCLFIFRYWFISIP
ncbi:hypothetical protein, partial [Prevotella histicola]|uniref:hypothetical protein n=1 Tax=Prevotella histicola TaxID=470565 RepID=UPI0028E6677F